MDFIVAKVAVEKTLYYFDELFDYIVPMGMKDEICAGMRVVVPFGKGNVKRIGMVFSLYVQSFDDDEKPKAKPIIRAADETAVLSDEMLKLAKWMKDNTFCTYFDAVKTMLPTGMTLNLNEHYQLAKVIPETELTPQEEELLFLLKSAKTAREFDLYLDCTENRQREKTLKSLLEKGIVEKTDTMNRKIGDETQQMAELCGDYLEQEYIKRLTPKQRPIIAMLEEAGCASVKEICYLCGVTAAVVKTLEKRNIVRLFEFEKSRAVSADAVATDDLNKLVFSPAQQKVFDGLKELMNEEKPECALLYGITGSGKTSVFIKLIEETLSQGKTAIMLVPEIALTPQMVGNFQRMFGNEVAIIHSALSIGQRTDEYKRIERGEARIVIGTRSAIFAPVKNIGIIVIDEEGEHTYKSEKSPRYHARNIAKQRCFYHRAFLLLASATPSIDSFFNAQSGRYHLFELKERYSRAILPDVYMVDMKEEAEYGNKSNFSEALLSELKTNLERGEQSLLLLNRRGYHTYANCIRCGAVVECPNCNIPLTYHKVNESVICHYCGYTKRMPEKCEKCGSKFIRQSGTGTQRIEDEITAIFPKARILRMDADTTMSKNAFEKGFSDFGAGKYDIVIGTQMIAKGLDFENVTLVGVLLIDKSLYAGDYQGYERTFSLITQVVGRSGRGEKKGRAYLQTFSPDNYVLQLAATQDYAEFYKQEIEVRKALLFPPFCDICMVAFAGIDEAGTERGAKEFARIFSENVKAVGKTIPIRLLGPTKIGTGKMNGKFRVKLIIKCKNSPAFRAAVSNTLKAAYKSEALRNISFFADINGEIM